MINSIKSIKMAFFSDKSISKKKLDILRMVNNPKVIKLLNDCVECEVRFPKIYNYITDIILNWQLYLLENTVHINNKGINDILLNKIEFNKKKKVFDKLLNRLDKKYRFNTKIRGAILISMLRKIYLDNLISTRLFYEMIELCGTKKRFHSGILEIAIMMKPDGFSCQWDCDYCPNQKDMPRSYIREEPAVRRGAQNGFDCAKQIFSRISSYIALGQPGDKGEFIILGGTFSSYDDVYKREFMRDIYYACNVYYDENKRDRYSLETEKQLNQTALFKVIGLTIETRPDCITIDEIKSYIDFGVTRVQMGVQHTDDAILKKIHRGCYSKDTIRAIRLLKESGFKVLCHFMPNLPTASPEKDKEMFDIITSNPDYFCDEWKIYPTSVTTTSTKDIEDVNTKIEEWFLTGEYIPYPQEVVEEVVQYAKELVGDEVRISRVFRDIPVDNIIGGADVPHMRQKVQKKMEREGKYCKCIRCREIRNNNFTIDDIYYSAKEYIASNGTEYFISANVINPKIPQRPFLVGFCRLRINNTNALYNNPIKCLRGCGIIRELHVYGRMVPSYLSDIMNSNSQHRGIGSKLVHIAEEIVVKHNIKKMAVISGVGVRKYYEKKLDYKLEDNYMIKELTYEYMDYYYTKYMIQLIYFMLYLSLFGMFLECYKSSKLILYDYFD